MAKRSGKMNRDITSILLARLANLDSSDLVLNKIFRMQSLLIFFMNLPLVFIFLSQLKHSKSYHPPEESCERFKEGVNKKFHVPKLWPPLPQPLWETKNRFFLFLCINIPLETVLRQGWQNRKMVFIKKVFRACWVYFTFCLKKATFLAEGGTFS